MACVQDSIQLLASHGCAAWAAALCHYCALSCAYCDRCRDARGGEEGVDLLAPLLLLCFAGPTAVHEDFRQQIIQARGLAVDWFKCLAFKRCDVSVACPCHFRVSQGGLVPQLATRLLFGLLHAAVHVPLFGWLSSGAVACSTVRALCATAPCVSVMSFKGWASCVP